MKKFLFILLIIILLIITAINLLSAFNCSLFGFRIFKIASGSMEPELKVNDFIIVKDAKEYKEGDIVTYQKEKEVITHRIVSVEGEEITTKGDANKVEDASIKKTSIIGKVIYHFRFISFIYYLLSKPLSWLLILGIGILTITILTYTFNTKKGKHTL